VITYWVNETQILKTLHEIAIRIQPIKWSIEK
jgi:hypothetical protein